MKNKMVYIGDDKLREVPDMVHPKIEDYGEHWEIFQEDLKQFHKQDNACKEYHVTTPHSFEVGKEYVEGKDYEIGERMEKLSDEQYRSQQNQNRDNAIIGYMVKVAIPLKSII